jgi:hypothetical protein
VNSIPADPYDLDALPCLLRRRLGHESGDQLRRSSVCLQGVPMLRINASLHGAAMVC